MEQNDTIFIRQQPIEDELYTRLQKKAIDQLQHLSGKNWTDYNAHDAGVTIMDIANYALTELDYKLGFDTVDYLTEKNSDFVPEKYGLFLPEHIFPTRAVTIEDYQKLLLTTLPAIENISIECRSSGLYDVEVELSPFESSSTTIVSQIRDCFNDNRNLCENLGEVTICSPSEIFLQAEIEIQPGYDVTLVLSQFYGTVRHYLSGAAQFHSALSTMPPQEWFDGLCNDSDCRVEIPTQPRTETELYYQLKAIPGIQMVKTIYLTCGGNIINTYAERYRLHIPRHKGEMNVVARVGHTIVGYDHPRFIEALRAVYYEKNASRFKHRFYAPQDKPSAPAVPQGTYRPLYSHNSIVNDFPSIYGLGLHQIAATASDEQKARSKQLTAYLTLFDSILQRGLLELQQLPALCSLDPAAPFTQHIIPNNLTKLSQRQIARQKKQVLDMLDHLYCTDSNPPWLAQYSYDQSPQESLQRRIAFLRAVPELTAGRAKASNVYKPLHPDNISALKNYLSLLLDMNRDENISVGNLLPSHNLILLINDDNNSFVSDNINSRLVDHQQTEPIEAFTASQIATLYTPQACEQMRRELPYFNNNMISSRLFRAGIDIKNFKMVYYHDGDYLLVFCDPISDVWMNLGRSADKAKLNHNANILWQYLIELNRHSDVVYVVEHIFLRPTATSSNVSPMAVSLFFSNWSSRMKSPHFRNILRQVVAERLPAHLNADIYWLNIPQMQHFEECYQLWRAAIRNHYPEQELARLQQNLWDILMEMENEPQHQKLL